MAMSESPVTFFLCFKYSSPQLIFIVF